MVCKDMSSLGFVGTGIAINEGFADSMPRDGQRKARGDSVDEGEHFLRIYNRLPSSENGRGAIIAEFDCACVSDSVKSRPPDTASGSKTNRVVAITQLFPRK